MLHVRDVGRTGHVSTTCAKATHPDMKNLDVPWKDSVQGKALIVKGFFVLPKDRNLGGGLVPWSVTEALQGKAIPSYYCNTLIDRIGYNRDVIPITIRTNDKSAILRTLLDTGSLEGLYVNQDTLRTFNELGILASVSDCVHVCGAVEWCTHTTNSITLPITLFNELTSKKEEILIRATVLDTPYDIIISKPEVIKYNLMAKLWTAFTNSAILNTLDITHWSWNLLYMRNTAHTWGCEVE
jgi:hypothetical protein